MSDAEMKARASPAVRTYLFLSFGGLIGMVPLLLLKGLDLWCVFPLILGALSLLVHWRGGPIFVLLTLAIIFSLHGLGFDPLTMVQMCLEFSWQHYLPKSLLFQQTPILDVLLCVCVLVYLAGHYRLQGLVHNVVPPGLRGQGPLGRLKVQSTMTEMNPRRVVNPLPGAELLLLGLTLLLCTLGAAYLWRQLAGLTPPMDFGLTAWQALVFIWISALALILAWSVFGYLGRRRATPEESLQLLQDQVWRETRREQSALNRWLAWSRLRWQHWRER